MLDRKFIVSNIEKVRSNIAARGMTIDLDLFISLDAKRRELDSKIQGWSREANEISQAMLGSRQSRVENDPLAERARELRDHIAKAKVELAEIQAESDAIHHAIPNMTDPRVPIGADDSANVVIGHGMAATPKFAFQPRDHLEIGEAFNLIDMAAGSLVAGHGFYFLKREAVLLDLALQFYALSELARENFILLQTPDLARSAVLAGTGYSPRGAETQIYMVGGSDLGLIATSEITIAGAYAGSMLVESELPLLLCGLSHCFRTEAGAYGRATRGLYRVHQFSKVEMFAFTTPNQSDEMHMRLLALQRRLFDGLGIPYRYVENATGDLGAAAYRKFDLEAWMPGRLPAGAWGEVTSTSNCTDYQARRLNIKYRKAKGTAYVHTLNGTAIATGRAIIAILENFQRSDGSVAMPDALRPWLPFTSIGPAKATG